jgi:hypothetical protein
LDVVALAVAGDELSEEIGAAVAELRDEVAELVSGVGDGEGLGTFGDAVTG